MNRNAHAPERQPGESREQYLERRQVSRNMLRAATGGWYGNAKATSRQLQRDELRKNGKLRGTFGAGLVNAWAKKRRDAFPKVGKPRDAHGAVTFVSTPIELVGIAPTSREFVLSGGKEADGESFHAVRRIWLAGISAQRGY